MTLNKYQTSLNHIPSDNEFISVSTDNRISRIEFLKSQNKFNIKSTSRVSNLHLNENDLDDQTEEITERLGLPSPRRL